LRYTLSCGELDQWPGHGVNGPTKIALGKRIVTRHLGTQVEADPQRDRSGSYEILLKIWEKIAKCALTTTKQSMHVLRLRRSASVISVTRENVTLEHGYLFKVVGENTSSRQTGHPGTDYDRLPTYLV